jgi:3-oxoacyl-[acyl-carrier-protein] synthase-1
MSTNRQNEKTKEEVVITGMGMITPVGRDSVMAPAAVWSGISRVGEIPGFVTRKGVTSVGGFVYGVTDERSGSDRLLSMAIPAAQEALYMAEEFYEDLDLSSGKLFLSLSPPERPVYEEFDRDDMQTLLELAQAEKLHSVEVIREGHAGGIVALSKSITLLREKKAKVCIVGGVDSLVEYPSLAWLEEEGRLKTDDRPTGFIPGEAAAFLVLELASAAGKRGAPILGEIIGTGYTMEEAHILSAKPLIAKGLAESIKESLNNKKGEIDRIDGIICDLNGEYYRMKEWGLAMGRVFDGSTPVPELWHPAEFFGDVGAASAVVCTAIAVSAINNGYFSGPNVIIWASSDTGGRGSVLLTAYKDK